MRGATKRRSVVSVEAGNAAASAATAGGGADDGSDKQCCFRDDGIISAVGRRDLHSLRRLYRARLINGPQDW